MPLDKLYNHSLERRLAVLLYGIGKDLQQKLEASTDYLEPMPELENELTIFRHLAYVHGHDDEEIDDFVKLVSHRKDDDVISMERHVPYLIQKLLDD